MKTFFTSDLHAGHNNILKYCSRPFETIEEHDEALVANWNNVVNSEDTVYVIGDVLMGKHKSNPDAFLSRLQGELHLIFGNHDGESTKNSYFWNSVQPYLEIKLQGKNIILCHYKFSVFNRSHKGAIQLFGHSHGNAPQNNQQIDVGVDCWNYCPITLDQILDKAKSLPSFQSIDHHGRD